MRNKFSRIVMFVTLYIIGSLVVNVCAQKNLEKWVEKCGEEDDVNYSLINKKDRITKKTISNMISISFKASENSFLLDELHDALGRDRKDAIEIIESKKGGVLKPEIYKFYNNSTKEDITYIFSETKDGRVSVVITTRGTTTTI